jgi:hypothetical protein
MLPYEGKNYLVVTQEDLSGWVKAWALSSANSYVVAKFLWEDIVCRHGCFSKLVINRGPENKGYVAAFTAKYGIKQVQVFVYYLPTNRMIEQGHKLITDALSKLTDSGLGS